MGNWWRILVFAAVAALLIVFAALNSRAKAPRANTAFPKPALDQPVSPTKGREVAVISGGCFWGVQAVYEHTKGVISATSGYAGGTPDTAQYETVSSGKTDHAESVQILYDPSEITYGQILMIFFSVAHNPTELNKQGPDWGTQYRSVIFFHSPEQEAAARASKEKLEKSGRYNRPVVTQIVPAPVFYRAEEYHQRYLETVSYTHLTLPTN